MLFFSALFIIHDEIVGLLAVTEQSKNYLYKLVNAMP